MSLTIDELIEKSKDQRKRKRYNEAVISAIAAIDLEPDNGEAWRELGLSRFELIDYEKAVVANRFGSTKSDVTPGSIDNYNLEVLGLEVGTIYICPYHKWNSNLAPRGFTLTIDLNI